MLIIAIIMSGLALLAATVCLILLIQEKKRNQKRNTAVFQLIETECKKVIKEDFEQRQKIYAECSKLCNRIENLEKGIVPDFEEAKQATRAVDDFNKGLSNILGFDPMESLQRERQKAQLGGEEI